MRSTAARTRRRKDVTGAPRARPRARRSRGRPAQTADIRLPVILTAIRRESTRLSTSFAGFAGVGSGEASQPHQPSCARAAGLRREGAHRVHHPRRPATIDPATRFLFCKRSRHRRLTVLRRARGHHPALRDRAPCRATPRRARASRSCRLAVGFAGLGWPRAPRQREDPPVSRPSVHQHDADAGLALGPRAIAI